MELLRYRDLIGQLVLRDLKLKYRRSYLGYIWSILNPLLMMIVLVIVFSNLFKFDIPNFAVYVLSGQIIFVFFAESTSSAVSSIISNASLLKKVYVPKYIFTLSKVASSFVNTLLALVALALVMVITKVSFSISLFALPLVLFQVFLFSVGVGLFLAALTVFFRDVQYLWGVVTSIWMYLSPVIYPVSIIPQEYRWIYDNLNPLSGYIVQFRNLVLDGVIPSTNLVIQGMIYAIVALMIGVDFFGRKQKEFILYI